MTNDAQVDNAQMADVLASMEADESNALGQTVARMVRLLTLRDKEMLPSHADGVAELTAAMAALIHNYLYGDETEAADDTLSKLISDLTTAAFIYGRLAERDAVKHAALATPTATQFGFWIEKAGISKRKM